MISEVVPGAGAPQPGVDADNLEQARQIAQRMNDEALQRVVAEAHL